jgi:two-component system, NtrC family, nitrogen regulation response regulator NtrX
LAHNLILIVEDEPSIRDQYSAILKKRDYNVRVAKNTKEAKEMLEAETPDLLIMDIFLPGQDGVSFLKSAAIAENYPKTKVLVMSNYDTSELEQQCTGLGVSKIALKAEYTPYEVADLVAGLL